MDQWKRTAELWMKKRFVNANFICRTRDCKQEYDLDHSSSVKKKKVSRLFLFWCYKILSFEGVQSHIHHLFLQFVSQVNTHLLPSRNQKSPYRGFFWHSEVHVRRLRIRIVSQSVVCVHSVDLGSCCLVRVCFFTDSSLVVPLYISFCMNHLSNRNMMGVHVWVSPTSVFIIVLEWHLLPSGHDFNNF